MIDDPDEFKFKSLAIVNSVSRHKRSITLSFLIIIGLIVVLLFLPWQQTVVGYGKVSVFSPMDRPQKIFSQIDGKIKMWKVYEGQSVKAGDVLLEIDEINSNFLDINQLNRLYSKKKALIQKKEAINDAIKAINNQIKDLNLLPENIDESQKLLITQQKDNLTAAKKSLQTTKFNLDRIRQLYNDGLRSKRDLELAELEITTKMVQQNIASRDLELARFNRDQNIVQTNVKIQSAQSELANSKEKYATVEAEIIKLEIDISNLEKRMHQKIITAPINGQITRLHAVGRSETVKAGQSLAVIVPDVVDQAVELYVNDYNSPLMKEGRKVRLMFSGWPAVQFSGWPFLSVGTFGGIIAAVDAVDNGNNKFRVIIKPDLENINKKIDSPWPQYPLLRPGTQAQGWILLDVVTIGFEIWRLFNGFPASFPKADHNVQSKGEQGFESKKDNFRE